MICEIFAKIHEEVILLSSVHELSFIEVPFPFKGLLYGRIYFAAAYQMDIVKLIERSVQAIYSTACLSHDFVAIVL